MYSNCGCVVSGSGPARPGKVLLRRLRMAYLNTSMPIRHARQSYPQPIHMSGCCAHLLPSHVHTVQDGPLVRQLPTPGGPCPSPLHSGTHLGVTTERQRDERKHPLRGEPPVYMGQPIACSNAVVYSAIYPITRVQCMTSTSRKQGSQPGRTHGLPPPCTACEYWHCNCSRQPRQQLNSAQFNALPRPP